MMKTKVKVLYYPVIVSDADEITRTYDTTIQVVCIDERSPNYDWLIEGISESPSDQFAIWTSSQQEFADLVPGDDIADGCIIQSIDRESPMVFEIEVDFADECGNFLSERQVY